MLTDHPSSSTFPVPGHRSSSLDGDTQASLSPDTSGRIPRCFPAESHGHSRVSWVFPRTPPKAGVQGASDSDALFRGAVPCWSFSMTSVTWPWVVNSTEAQEHSLFSSTASLTSGVHHQVQWLPLRWPEWRWTEGSSRCSQQTHTIPLGLPDLFSFLPGQWITLRRSVISGIVLPDTIMLKDGVGYGQT